MKTLFNSTIFFLLILSTSCKDSNLAGVDECIIDDGLSKEISEEASLTKSESTQTKENEQTIRPCKIYQEAFLDGTQIEISAHLRNFTDKQEIKMQEALKRLKIVVNSQEFKDRVINHKYKDEYTFIDNDGRSNEQIYDLIVAGAETLDPVVDNEMDLDFTMYYKRNRVVGYTYPSTNRIWVNSRYFNSASYGKVAKNALHEWTHKIGFGHSYKYNSKRPFSVPYGVGSIIEELVDGM